MFKTGRWRNEKNKIKALFKLHFHATQLSQVGWDTLIVSIIPVDIGKPTLKLEKATVRDGNCSWENPVQETVKFSQDPKTGKINEKIYNFVVSSGSSKASFVGEASIDFAIYATSTKTCSLSLPLKNAKGEAVLHVSIQRLQENTDQREAEEIEKENTNYKERSLKAQLSITDADGTASSNSADDELINKPNLQIVGLNGNHRASSVSDLTLSSSGSSSELVIPRDFGSKTQPSLHHKTTSDASRISQEDRIRSQWEWLGTADESVGENCVEGSTIIIEKLKSELAAFSRQAELSDLELQTLKKQIVKESKKGQDLLKEASALKEERDLFKQECENLKSTRKHIDEVKVKDKLKFEGGEWDPLALLDELRQELYYEKDLNSNLRIQLEKTQESNNELILAVRDLDEMLEQKNKEVSISFEFNEAKSESDDEEQKALNELVKEHTNIKDAHILETEVRDLCNELEIYRRDKDDLEAQLEQISLDYEILKQENHDIAYKLEQSEIQEQLKMQYECSTPYTVINELENHIEDLENQLKTQSNELSESLDKVKDLENHVRDLENQLKEQSSELSESFDKVKDLENHVKDLENQLKEQSNELSESLDKVKDLGNAVRELEEEMERRTQGFEADVAIVMNEKVEVEKRAIRAEESLRKIKWRNGETAERLQEEFRKLSIQMAYAFEENEKLALKALSQADELRLQKSYLEDMLEKSREETKLVKDEYEGKISELSNELSKKDEKVEQLGNEKKQSEENFERRLETTRTSMESEIELLRKELKVSRRVKDEKEKIVVDLEKETEALKSDCDEMKRSLFQDEFEKEKSRKLCFQMKGELKKKEEAISSLEKKLKDGLKVNSRSNNNKCVVAPLGTKEVANMKDKIKLLEGQIKLKELALENSTNKFLEKEKDFQHKIEGLERKLETLDLNTTEFCEFSNIKMAKGYEEVISNGNKHLTATVERNTEMSTEKSLDGLCNEIELLRERNKAMEGELKEMQERYSEISLKFAEVEGERQQLVMTVRNLKNVKRSQ